jgi:site-specific recombinase XerD
MKALYVQGIGWSGGELSSYVVLKDGEFTSNSIVAVPTLYLLSQAKEGKLKNSLAAAADDLKGFFQTLEDHNQDWKYLSDQDISGYLYGCLKRKGKLCDRSIERKKSTIRKLYKWAAKSGFLEHEPVYSYNYQSNEIRNQGQGFKKVDFDLYNKYCTDTIFNHLLAHVVADSEYKRERDELVMILGRFCGLRASEVTDPRNLQTEKLQKLISVAEKNNKNTITIPIIGKGEKLRHVDVPAFALGKIKFFMQGRRATVRPGHLICSKVGKPLSARFASDIFCLAKKSALPSVQEVIDEMHAKNSELHFINKESFHNLGFHALRHTYATNLVDFCYKHGFDPWQYVPEQMGHEDVDTTKAYVIFDGKLNRREKIRRALSGEQNYP